MRYGRLAAGVATAGLAAELLTSCGDSLDALTPEAPNGTIEQVEHNLGYKSVLSKLALTQTISLQTSNGEKAYIFNFTESKVDPTQFSKILFFYDRLEATAQPTERTVEVSPDPVTNPADTMPRVRLSTVEASQPATEHDYVLVPSDTPMPKSFGDVTVGGVETTGVTAYFAAISQTISVVKQPTNAVGKTVPFTANTADSAITTEACQSLVDVDPASYAGIEDAELADRLAQETVCNGLGSAFIAAINDVPYARYKDSLGVGYIRDDQAYAINPYAVDKKTYTAMTEAV